MGFLKKIVSNLTGADKQFTEIVKASDNGEEWANRELQKMWQSNDPTLIPRIHQARVSIYENAAKSGNRDAILKYARGLAYSDRHQESLHWYMQLIEKKDTEAMLELALDYTEFGGFGEDEAKHEYWIQQAAMLGNAQAQAKYGLILDAKGQTKQALDWYKKSAEQGNTSGKIGYASALDLVIMKMIHEKSNDIETIKSLYYTIEDLCIEVLNESEDDSEIDKSFGQLYNTYLYPPKGVCEPMPYRAAYFIYKSAVICDNEYSMDRLQKTATEYNLGITQRTLQEWNEMSFDEWTELHNINE